MELSNVVIREMKEGEQKTVAKVGRKAFQFFEALFIGTPKQAMVAEYDGKIIGSILYKTIPYRTKGIEKGIVYIDIAFVDPDFHGMGVGKKLYTETFHFLWNQGFDGMTALVKDDNVGSWKLLVDNGFKRVSIPEAVRHFGPWGMLKQYFLTPYFISVGMDFYMVLKNEEVNEKKYDFLQIAYFFLMNILMLSPLWFTLYHQASQKSLYFIAAYFTTLILFLLPRLITAWIYRKTGKFRFNNGGSFVLLLLSLFGSLFIMNANWYPDKYENTKAFRKKLAVPELIKWCIFICLPLLIYTGNPFFSEIAQISRHLLIFLLIPIYPFEPLGSGRIYNYSKKLWLFTVVITVVGLMSIG